MMKHEIKYENAIGATLIIHTITSTAYNPNRRRNSEWMIDYNPYVNVYLLSYIFHR